jgi:uncharacterized protein
MMKQIISLVTGMIICCSLPAQDTSKNNTVNGMELRDCFFVMLTDGPNSHPDSATEAKIMGGHVATILRLKKMGKLLLSGFFTDRAKWFGLYILDCKTVDEVKQYLQTDPAIASGRLDYEIHPWRTLKNCLFQQ